MIAVIFVIESEEKICDIDERYDKDRDWFISTIKKSTILSILLIIKDILITKSEKEPTRKEYTTKRDKLMSLNQNFGEELVDLPWKRVRNVTKGMWRKYKKIKEEDNLEKFYNFVELARGLWKLKLA